MICPKCGGEMRTVDSRSAVALQVRRRECQVCHHRFCSEEKPAESNVFRQVQARSMRAFRAKAPAPSAESPGRFGHTLMESQDDSMDPPFKG